MNHHEDTNIDFDSNKLYENKNVCNKNNNFLNNNYTNFDLINRTVAPYSSNYETRLNNLKLDADNLRNENQNIKLEDELLKSNLTSAKVENNRIKTEIDNLQNANENIAKENKRLIYNYNNSKEIHKELMNKNNLFYVPHLPEPFEDNEDTVFNILNYVNTNTQYKESNKEFTKYYELN